MPLVHMFGIWLWSGDDVTFFPVCVTTEYLCHWRLVPTNFTWSCECFTCLQLLDREPWRDDDLTVRGLMWEADGEWTFLPAVASDMPKQMQPEQFSCTCWIGPRWVTLCLVPFRMHQPNACCEPAAALCCFWTGAGVCPSISSSSLSAPSCVDLSITTLAN